MLCSEPPPSVSIWWGDSGQFLCSYISGMSASNVRKQVGGLVVLAWLVGAVFGTPEQQGYVERPQWSTKCSLLAMTAPDKGGVFLYRVVDMVLGRTTMRAGRNSAYMCHSMNDTHIIVSQVKLQVSNGSAVLPVLLHDD